MKKLFFLLFTAVLHISASAQNESRTLYNFLRLPVSAHSAALGGENITVIDDDASLIFSNPALLSNVSNKTLNLNYMNYMQGANTLSAAYDFSVMERGNVAVSAQYMDYGKMKQTNTEGMQTGEFSAKDIALTGYFSYLLSEQFSAGIAAKLITSYIGDYNSIGVGVDLGINYYNAENEWSVSAVVKNLGGQVKAYDDEYEPMPIDVQLGVSKRLVGTPLRFNFTLVDLNHTSYKLKNHLAIGADFILSQSMWAGIGYNFRRAAEMTIGDGENASSHGAGFSIGAGLNLEKFGVNVAWGKYHVGSSSILANINIKL